MAGYRTDTVSRGKSHAASGLQFGKDVERLHLIAFECLDADVVQILADTLPGPALLQRQPDNLSLPRTQVVNRRRKLGAGEEPLLAIAAYDYQRRLGLRARHRPQKLADELARMGALLPLGGGHIPQIPQVAIQFAVYGLFDIGRLRQLRAPIGSLPRLIVPPRLPHVSCLPHLYAWLRIPLTIPAHHRRPPSLRATLTATEPAMSQSRSDECSGHVERAGCILFSSLEHIF